MMAEERTRHTVHYFNTILRKPENLIIITDYGYIWTGKKNTPMHAPMNIGISPCM